LLIVRLIGVLALITLGVLLAAYMVTRKPIYIQIAKWLFQSILLLLIAFLLALFLRRLFTGGT